MLPCTYANNLLTFIPSSSSASKIFSFLDFFFFFFWLKKFKSSRSSDGSGEQRYHVKRVKNDRLNRDFTPDKQLTFYDFGDMSNIYNIT